MPDAYSQYFGRNKVQYEDFNFQILKTQNFDVYHYPQEEKAIKDFARLSERWYQRHSALLGHTFNSPNPLIIYANHADFQQNDIVPSVGVGTGGVTEGLRNRVIMPFAEANSSTNHVLGHELVHAFQYDIARTTDKIGGIRSTSNMPLWFIEGMAEYLSVGPEDTHTGMWLRDALLQDDLPSIKDLSNSQEYFPYRFGHSVWTYITGEWGDDVVKDLYVNSAQRGLKKGFENTLGLSRDSVSTLWQNSIERKYSDIVEQRNKPAEVGSKIFG
ncbi:MAG: basic secretory protein-like protein [Balneolaceae bacterium]|nr:basic secretory protein-like protein [Balneolaceae bacterium]